MSFFRSGKPCITCLECNARGPRSNVYNASNSEQATLFYSKLRSPAKVKVNVKLGVSLIGPDVVVGAGVKRKLSSKKLLQGVHIGKIKSEYLGDRCVPCFRALLSKCTTEYKGLRNEVNIILRQKNIGVPPQEDDEFEGETECDSISAAGVCTTTSDNVSDGGDDDFEDEDTDSEDESDEGEARDESQETEDDIEVPSYQILDAYI